MQESDNWNMGLNSGENKWAKLSDRFIRIRMPESIIKGRSVGIIFWNHRFRPEGKQAEKKHLFQIVYTFFPFFGGVGTRGVTAHRTASFGNCNLVRMRGIMYT